MDADLRTNGKGSQPRWNVTHSREKIYSMDCSSDEYNTCDGYEGGKERTCLGECDRQQGEDSVLTFTLSVPFCYLATLLPRRRRNRKEWKWKCEKKKRGWWLGLNTNGWELGFHQQKGHRVGENKSKWGWTCRNLSTRERRKKGKREKKKRMWKCREKQQQHQKKKLQRARLGVDSGTSTQTERTEVHPGGCSKQRPTRS